MNMLATAALTMTMAGEALSPVHRHRANIRMPSPHHRRPPPRRHRTADPQTFGAGLARLFRTNIIAMHATKRRQSDAGSADVDWHMRRDACDEWLDEALVERPTTAASIFETASAVVEHFVSAENADRSIGNGARGPKDPLLRRVVHNDVDNSHASQERTFHWTDGMFAPLFGTRNEGSILSARTDDISAAPSRATNRTPKKGTKRRTNLKITVAYRGIDFCGWEDQRHELYRGDGDGKDRGGGSGEGRRPGTAGESAEDQRPRRSLPSVQGALVDILDPLLGDRRSDEDDSSAECGATKKLRRRRRSGSGKPLHIKAAGRTDRGVSAIGQVCRVRTWREVENIEAFVMDSVNNREGEDVAGLCVRNVERVGDDFHPSFGASCRAYAYLIDLGTDDDGAPADDMRAEAGSASRISRDVVPRLDRMLRALEGRELDYFGFSYGKVKTQTTLCTLHRARAGIVEWSDADDAGRAGPPALCVELVGDRFLRRMVRILVATALREARRGGDEDEREGALLEILAARDRRLRSRAAPPYGLLFVGAEF